MRRFELVEGTQSKFWQISIEEASLRIQFGRIGQNGQVQLKKLASAADAQAELEKLVREKTKKGYTEVGSSKPAAPTTKASTGHPSPPTAPAKKAEPREAAPAPAPAAADEADDEASVQRAAEAARAPKKEAPTSHSDLLVPRFHWTEEATAAETKRNRWRQEKTTVSAAAALPALHALFGALAEKKTWSDDAIWGDCTRHRDHILDTWARGKMPSTFDPELEGATAILASDEKGVPFVVASWIERAGFGGALQALARMWEFRRVYKGSSYDVVWLARVDPSTNWDSSTCYGKRYAVYDLQRRFAALEESAKADAMRIATLIWETSPLTVRVGLAKVTRRRDWLDQVAREAADLRAGGAYPFDARPLVNELVDGESLARFVAAFGIDHVDPFVLAGGARLEAQSTLEQVFVKAGHRDRAIESGEVLSTLETLETAKTLAQFMDKKGLDVLAKRFFERRADLGLAALAGIVGAGGKLATVAEPTLRVLIERNADLAREVAKRLDAKAAHAIEGLLPSATPARVAPRAKTSELPSVLIAPPWTTKVDPPPTIAGLVATTAPPKVHFTEEERKKLFADATEYESSLRSWYKAPDTLKRRTKAMDDWATVKLAKERYFFTGWIDLMTDEAALRAITGLDLTNYRLDASDISYCAARFEGQVLASFIELGKSLPVAVAQGLERVESVEVATFFAQTMARSKQVRALAPSYFKRYPETSAVALVPFALDKKTQRAGIQALHALLRVSDETTITQVARRYGDKAAQATLAAMAFDPLALSKPPPVPPFLDVNRAPPVLLRSGATVPPENLVHLVGLLGMSEARSAHPLLASVREACTPESLAAFAWALFQSWLATGGEPKTDWAFSALGHLGDDHAARKLAPFIRSWPGESAHARAVKGLDVLAQMGTDLALMLLDGIAEKIKFKGLQEKAREKIEEVAEERGLSRDELADRIAPRLDLDDDGSRTLSFGGRSFRVGFDEHLAPFVLDAEGKRLADLPKPGKSDDAAIAKESVDIWKTLKKDAKTVGASQIARLERAMCSGRRWDQRVFATFVVAHPLVRHLARRLLWRSYDGGVDGKPGALFRVAEDGSFATREDKALALAPADAVGLPHRLELNDNELREWGSVFADYEILQPFSQLDRQVFVATDPEKKSRELTRAAGLEVPTGRVIGLEAKGWRKGMPQDAGWIGDMYKPLGDDAGDREARLFAVLPLLDGGLLAGAMSESPPTQTLGPVKICKNTYGTDPETLDVLSPLAFSELVRDLESLKEG